VTKPEVTNTGLEYAPTIPATVRNGLLRPCILALIISAAIVASRPFAGISMDRWAWFLVLVLLMHGPSLIYEFINDIELRRLDFVRTPLVALLVVCAQKVCIDVQTASCLLLAGVAAACGLSAHIVHEHCRVAVRRLPLDGVMKKESAQGPDDAFYYGACGVVVFGLGYILGLLLAIPEHYLLVCLCWIFVIASFVPTLTQERQRRWAYEAFQHWYTYDPTPHFENSRIHQIEAPFTNRYWRRAAIWSVLFVLAAGAVCMCPWPTFEDGWFFSFVKYWGGDPQYRAAGNRLILKCVLWFVATAPLPLLMLVACYLSSSMLVTGRFVGSLEAAAEASQQKEDCDDRVSTAGPARDELRRP
jgi:hypothetical protein